MTNNIIYDYFIVGFGLAGICFAETALQKKKSVFVFDTGFNNSSRVAAGVFNAVILKRFTLTSKAKEQIDLLCDFYPKIEKRINQKLFFKIPTYRKLVSVEEQNNFIVASDRPLFHDFLFSEIIFKEYDAIDSPFGFGYMKQTGYVDTAVLINKYKEFLSENNSLDHNPFEYSELKITDDFVEYKGKRAKQIIFSEGFGMKNNPFFSELPLDGAKGEVLFIKAENLKLDVILKAGKFILPVGDDLYKIGATYDWVDKTDIPTDKAKEELLSELRQVINCDFEVIEHKAGIRPTVKDRNPLVGKHPDYKNIYILNGLGTRGVMQGPYLAQTLFDFIEFNVPLSSEINIDRFNRK